MGLDVFRNLWFKESISKQLRHRLLILRISEQRQRNTDHIGVATMIANHFKKNNK